MFEDKTPEALKQAMLESIQAGQGLSPLAGGFADGVVGPAAVEMSKLYMALSAVPSMLFVDESSGGYIDLVGRQYYDITRRAGTTASCAISFVGTPGLVVPQGTAFLTGGGLSFSLAAAVTLGAEGTGSGRLEADAVGSAYNVEAGAVDRMYVNLAGLTSYTNGAASGGTDPESDAALLARIRERVQQPPTSGNGYQYRQWAMAVPGVGNAKVTELPDGPGTVGVVLVDANREAPGEDIVEAVEAAIEQERPVGAAVSVSGATERSIDLTAAVTLTQGGSTAAVEEALAGQVTAYFHTLVDEHFTPVYYNSADDGPYPVLYNRVLGLLLGIPGVEDFSALTLGGGTGNITLTKDQVPVLGSVRVTETA